MSKPRGESGQKNIIGPKLKILRKQHGLSQRDLARELQILGLPIDKNATTRIETDKRCVADIEPRAFAKIFSLSCDALLDEEEAENPGK